MGTIRTVPADHEALEGISLGNCVTLSEAEIMAYDETEKMISYKVFRSHFTRGMYNALSEDFKYEIDPRAGLTLKNDWHISFGRGTLNGRKVVCMHHSAIHYFFLAASERNQ